MVVFISRTYNNNIYLRTPVGFFLFISIYNLHAGLRRKTDRQQSIRQGAPVEIKPRSSARKKPTSTVGILIVIYFFFLYSLDNVLRKIYTGGENQEWFLRVHINVCAQNHRQKTTTTDEFSERQLKYSKKCFQW